MAIEITRRIQPEIFQRNVKIVEENGESYFSTRFGVRDINTNKTIIDAEYNYIQICDEYGFIARKDAYYYAFNSKGVMFVADVLGIEAIGRHGVLVFEDAIRSKSVLVHWLNI